MNRSSRLARIGRNAPREGLAFNSTFPVRSAGLARTLFLPSGSSLSRHERTGTRGTTRGGAPAIPPRPGRSTIPPDVLALVDARDEHICVKCGRYREVIEHHHRRIKGIGGDIRPHTECTCCIISACPWWSDSACHPLIHKHREESEAEGFIIPRAAPFPFLYSVLVHGHEDAGGMRAWPTCGGEWTADEPAGAVA